MEHDQTVKIDLEPTHDRSMELRLGASHSDLVGTILDGKIRIDSLIGQGGMSVVFKGTHLVFNRPVAVKIITPGVGLSDMAVMRLQQEAKASFSLSHKNLASVHDMSETSDGLIYLVMDYADGEPLSNLLKSRPMEPGKAIEIVSQIAAGLKEAHSQGVIHRDIKPGNIIVQSLANGKFQVKVVDFGIAKNVTENAEELQKLTQTGEIFGTPLYMSPEQCRGAALDARSDVYSLGCLLYEALTGAPPFKGENAVSTILQHLETKAPSPDKRLKIPASVLKLLQSCLEKDPEDRYQSIAALEKDLDTIKSGGTTVSPLTARLSARLKASLIDALIVATIGGVLILPQAAYVFLSGTSQTAAGTNFSDWGFGRFVDRFVLPTYIMGIAVGFTEGWTGFFCFVLVIVDIAGMLHSGSRSSLSPYMLMTSLELLALAGFNWLYHAVFEASELQGTPGKLIQNLRVTTADGHRLSFTQATLRHACRSLLILCSITVVPIAAIGLQISRRHTLSETKDRLTNLGNSLSRCEVRERYITTRKSRAIWIVAVSAVIILPLAGILSTYALSSANSEVAPPSKIKTPNNLPVQAYSPVVRAASALTGYILDPRGREPENLSQLWSTAAQENARSLGLPLVANGDQKYQSLQGIDLTELSIGESSADGLIPVTVTGNLHILIGRQTWMSTRYKLFPFEILYEMRWGRSAQNRGPVVVRVVKFLHTTL